MLRLVRLVTIVFPDESRFLFLPNSYNISSGNYDFGSSNKYLLNGAVEAKVGNPDVTWETATKQNYGIDLHLLQQSPQNFF